MDTTARSAELDAQLATASELLKTAADEMGVDLGLLNEGEIADLLQGFMGQGPVEKVASTMDEQNTELTVADVSQELVKRAAAEQLDLTALSPEDYTACFDKVAAEMQDPAYFEAQAEKVAAESAQLEAGATLARGFYAELQKIAAEEEDKEEDEECEDKEKKASKLDAVKAFASKEKGRFMGGVSDLKAALTHQKNLPGGKGSGFSTKEMRNKRLVSGLKGVAPAAGVGAVGVGGAALAAGGGKKEASAAEIEAEALKIAQQYLIENGIDPDTGEKLATDEDPAVVLAAQILQERGWL